MFCILWFADTKSGTMALSIEDNYCRKIKKAVTLQHEILKIWITSET